MHVSFGWALAPIRALSPPTWMIPLLGLALGLAPGLATAQQTITGTVVDSRGTPIANAQVVVVGTPLGTVTDANGRFRLTGVSGADATVRVSLIGYRPVEQVMAVGGSAGRIVLQRAPVTLDEVVVTGTAGGAQRRAVANAVSNVRAGDIAETAPALNVGQLLNARAPGVLISAPSGNAGGGQRILIRGRSSISLPIGPLIYVDGVRVDNRQAGGGSGPASASRLNDFSPDEIESIEIIKGPAAATLYGTEAANGVIQIITKKGRPGETRIGVSMRQGVAFFANPEGRWAINYFDDPGSGQIIPYNLAQQESDRGTPIFRNAHTQGYNVDVSGGNEITQFYSSVQYNRDEGAVETTVAERFGGRLNVTATPNEKWSFDGQLGFSLNRTEFANGNVMFGSILSRPSTRDTPQRGFFTAPTEVWLRQTQSRQDVDRLTTGAEVRHQPLSWLSHRIRGGVDISNEDNTGLTRRMTPDDAQFFSAGQAAGSKTVDQINVLNTTLDYSATATVPINSVLGSATTGGFQYYRRNTTLLSASGQEFPAPDVTSIAGAATRLGSDDVIENTTVGFFIQEQISWNERVYLTAAVRGDDNSAFGQDFDFVTYPKFSASWVIGEEPWWNVGFVDALRLRVAWGKSGQQPDAFAALRTFEPITAQAGAPGVTPQFVGNAELGPEKAQEIELGFEAGLFGQRVGIDFTYYHQNTKDAIIARDVAPSTGFPQQQFVNAGEVRNRGVELMLNASVIQNADVGFDLGFNFAYNENKVLSLGIEGTEFLEFGFGNRFQPGYPVYGIFSRKVIAADRDADGAPINIMCDGGLPNGMPSGVPVDCATAPRVFAGSVDPKFEGSVTSNLALFQRLTITGLLDFKTGHRRWTSVFWCPGILDCEEEVFPERFDPVKAASSVLGLVDDHEWFRDMSFAKLREVSITYQLPDRWANVFGASRAQITVAGRNLHTWTGFQGLDPENDALFPEAATFGTPFEQNEIPQLRQFLTRINVTF